MYNLNMSKVPNPEDKVCLNCTHFQAPSGFLMALSYFRKFDLRAAGKVKNVKMNVEEQKKADSLIQSMFGEDLYPTNFSIDCGPKIKNQIEDRSSHANCIREDKFHKRDLVTELRSFLR